MKMKTRSMLIVMAMLCGCAKPPMPDAQRIGIVPDEITAVKIAVAVLTPIYGATQIRNESPFSGRLSNGVWEVRGTLHQPLLGVRKGGTAVVHISQSTGEILDLNHEK